MTFPWRRGPTGHVGCRMKTSASRTSAVSLFLYVKQVRLAAVLRVRLLQYYCCTTVVLHPLGYSYNTRLNRFWCSPGTTALVHDAMTPDIYC